MNYIVADTLLEAITRLDSPVQALVKQKVFDFQTGAAAPGGSYHRIQDSAQHDFWAYRVNRDIRIVVHQHGDERVLCYVDHHDDAYDWAARHRLRQNERTGVMQLVKVQRTVEDIVERRVEVVEEAAPLMDRYDDDYLLALGLPPEWLPALREVRGEDELLQVLSELPGDVAERLLDLHAGKAVAVPVAPAARAGWSHPDSARHFHVTDDQRALRQALAYPWERWIVFLHPEQKSAVERDWNGPALVTGGAGTGKTVVALHRARYLLEAKPEATVLLTTFSRTLAASLERLADVLMGAEHPARRRLRIANVHHVAHEYWSRGSGKGWEIAKPEDVRRLLVNANHELGGGAFDVPFLEAEWRSIVDAWGISDWPSYRGAARAGRGTPLGARQRRQVWRVFEQVLEGLREKRLGTWSQICYGAADTAGRRPTLRFDHVVVDEAQDFGPAELRLLRTLTAEGANDLYLAGDAGQRIYQASFPWSAVGFDVRGRSTALRVNYRTTEQIRRFADGMRASAASASDLLTNAGATISLLGGPEPEVVAAASLADEADAVGDWVRVLLGSGFAPRDIAVFARTNALLRDRAVPALGAAGVKANDLGEGDKPRDDAVSVCTMHRAKGLEFRAVVALGCEARQIPLPHVVSSLRDEGEREAFVERERNLLYVACTRARERLLVTFIAEPSPLLPSL